MSKQINLLDFKLECLQIGRTCLIYRLFGRNRLIEMIDSYDGMVYRGPFENVVAVGSRWTVQMKSWDMRYKNALIVAVGSRSNASDAFRAIRSKPL